MIPVTASRHRGLGLAFHCSPCQFHAANASPMKTNVKLQRFSLQTMTSESAPEPVPASCRRDITNAKRPDTAYTVYEEGDAAATKSNSIYSCPAFYGPRAIGLTAVTVSTMPLSPQFMEDVWVRRHVYISYTSSDSHLILSRSFSAAGHTLLVYDYLLTFREEFVYIWKAPWTVIKIVFLLSRYGNLIGQTAIRLEEAGLLAHNSQKFCQGFSIFTTCFMLVSIQSIHILVLLRAWAIWGTRRRVMMSFAWSYVGCIVVLVASAVYGLYAGDIQFQFLDVAQVCVATGPKYVWSIYVGSFILDAVLFVLTMRSLRIYSREFQQLYPSSLLHVLVRDATLFFIASMFINALTVISWTAFRTHPTYFLGKGFATPLLSVAGQRLVLNLRSLQTRSYETRDLSREVDRQLQAFAEVDLDDVEELEGVRE
ncbi:uncharacterized protein F5147DRAFT_835107 [Suillus discolor]|uniref:DUF6533 domain-containing protein n=1 Tax=Suillus discolor TaxID=1912936 RepID=A0A9P7JW83_9AGAM|nr:uncharacterized protein F5147DRAFT_835107 [Suillus discolor]KAG2112980.1 hypothetical protein F5147DRAFT_835107 [Suillus discolor]